MYKCLKCGTKSTYRGKDITVKCKNGACNHFAASISQYCTNAAQLFYNSGFNLLGIEASIFRIPEWHQDNRVPLDSVCFNVTLGKPYDARVFEKLDAHFTVHNSPIEPGSDLNFTQIHYFDFWEAGKVTRYNAVRFPVRLLEKWLQTQEEQGNFDVYSLAGWL